MLVNIQGAILPPEEAKVSVLDRGFLYGDSVYEVLRTYEGRLFALSDHLERLRRSAERLGIALPESAWLEQQLEATIDAAGNQESYCRIIVTRGSGPITLDPTTATGSLTILIVKAFEPFPAWMYDEGIKVSIPSVRRNLQSALDPAIKSGNYLNSVLALGEARRAGFDDALMLDVNGRVTEATSANVFVLLAGKLATPPLATGILEGVTRRHILALCREHGIPCEERDLTPAELCKAEEVMLTSTLKEVMPVVQVGETAIGEGHPGPASKRLRFLLAAHALNQVSRVSSRP